MKTPAASAMLREAMRDPQRLETAASALRQLHDESPQTARFAWAVYRDSLAMSATQPSSRPAGRKRERGSLEDGRAQLSGLIIDQADAALTMEIEAAIPSARASQRPELRRMLRAIRERTSKAAKPTTREN